jgi:serine/threonine protein kinase
MSKKSNTNSTYSTNSCDTDDSTNSTNSTNDIDWTNIIVNNRYIILNKLGSGSYCTVWSVYDIETNNMYALKIYNEEDTEDALYEIEVLDIIKTLNLPNSITYIETFKYSYLDDTFVMQIIELCGYSLNYIIKLFGNDFKNDKELYTKYINFVYESTKKVNETLSILHSYNYTHTDIKPENILIDIPNYENIILQKEIKLKHDDLINKNKKNKNKNKVNTISILSKNCIDIIKNINITEDDIKNYLKDFNFSIKICDFGTTMKTGDRTIYKKHTQYYKSPKILLKYDLDKTYDYWSIGCMLYELLLCDILFDPYDTELESIYGENEDRNLMYLITSAIGIPNKSILEKSKESDIYFTSDNKCPRGYINIKYKPFISDLINNINNIDDTNIDVYNKYIELINLISNYINYDILFN